MQFILKKRIIITQYGGSTSWQKRHWAIDYRARYENLYAPEGGTVRTYWGYAGGRWLELTTDSGYKLQFAHLLRYEASGRVKQGQIIAVTGSSGAWTSGPHLHLQVEKDGIRINPKRYFQRMIYSIDNNNNQYILFDMLKVGISIADGEELQKLKNQGLIGEPSSISDAELSEYIIYPGIETKRLKNILNL